MKVLICGSRGWNDSHAVAKVVEDLAWSHGTELLILHGAAQGPDMYAEGAAYALGVQTQTFPPNYGRHGRRAPLERNKRMLDEKPDSVVAFWDGKSTGTAHTMTEARKRGIPVEVIRR